jgi:hypothetical protein
VVADGKKKKGKKPKKPKQQQQQQQEEEGGSAPAQGPGSNHQLPVIQVETTRQAKAALQSIANGTAKGTLSDRLNSAHRHYDKDLATAWKDTLSKRERKAIVTADRAIIDNAAAEVKAIVHPFKVALDDHCESPMEAYVVVALPLEVWPCVRACSRYHRVYYDARVGATNHSPAHLSQTNGML